MNKALKLAQHIMHKLAIRESMPAPIISAVHTDNGGHSHWTVIDSLSGEKLWSENPEECKAMGYPVKYPQRIEDCLSACAGISDPQKTLTETKELLEELYSYLSGQDCTEKTELAYLNKIKMALTNLGGGQKL